MNEWRVGISAWIIQDGNYGDFHCHQRADFALEFFPRYHRLGSSPGCHANHLRGSKYKVNAQVVHASKGAWVIDFGIQAFQQARPPAHAREGEWLEAEIYLGIDPFFYFEDLAHNPQMPPLIYDWHIAE